MALLKWGEDEEKKDDEFESPVVKTIQSVQSGWQPTQDETATEDGEVQAAEPENQSYLVSEQKAEFDNQVQQQRANEEAQRVRAAQEANEANRRAAAAQELQAQSLPQNVTPVAGAASKAIPGFQVMSPKAQQESLRSRVFADQQSKAEEKTKFWGNVPLVGTALNWGAGLASVTGKVTGNRELQARADNQRKLLTLGMNTDEFNAYDEKTRNRLETLQTGVTGLGALDVFGAASLAKMPLVAGIKAAAKEGLTSAAGRQIIKEAGQQTAQQYGKNVAAGAVVSGIADPAIQAYIKDGDVDWSSVPSSMLQGGIWAAAIPEFSGKARLTQKLQSGDILTPEDSLEINAAIQEAKAIEQQPQLPRETADGVVTPIRDGNLSFDNRDEQTPIEIPAFNEITPIADSFTPATPPTPAPVAGNLTPVQQPAIDMPEQLTPEAPMSLDQLAERATLDNVTPVKDAPAMPAAPAPVADGTVLPSTNVPVVKSEEVRALQESRAGTSQAEEAEINQRLQQADTPEINDSDTQLNELDAALERGDISYDEHARLEDEIFARENAAGRAMAEDTQPSTASVRLSKEQQELDARRTENAQGNLPDDMNAIETPEAPKKVKKAETYLQRTVSSDASSLDAKRALRSVSEVDDLENLDELIDNIPKVTPKIKERLHSEYAAIEAAQKRINQIQNQFRKDAGKDGGGNMPLDKAKELAHERNKLVQDMQIAEKNMQSTIRRIESRQSVKQRVLNAGANLTSYSQGNMLASLPVQEKNIVGDIISSVTTAVQHPVKMATNIPEARLVSEFKRAAREVAQVRPQTLSEVPKYLIRSALSPVYAINNSLANVRGGMYRNELAKTELIKSGIKNPTAEQIKLQAMRAGNAREIIVNLNKGVGSAMSDPYKAASAADDYFKVLDSAKSHSELAKFAEETRQSTEILQGMMSGKATDGKITPMSLLINNLYPFINPAVNSFKKAIYQLDPTKASQMNEIRKTIQSPTRQNIAKLTKIAGTAASVIAIVSLLDDETIAYNDGDSDVSRPRGWSVKTGENTYMPVRAFGVFEPFIVGTGVTYEVMNGNVKTPKDALKMAASSLPYLSSQEFYSQSLEEIGEGNAWGYGTQSQAVARTKNLVPLANNGLDRWTDRNNGESTDANSAYVSKKNAEGKSVPDFLPWLDNAVGAGFGMENGITGTQKGMKGSYTPAGQRRTADNQGAFVNKTINDPNTKVHNDTIADLVDYGRENKLGADAKEMFNTYDTGKNNNFKSVQDSITFLGDNTDNAKKLENNAKIGVLAAQIRDGFYGDTGNDLLTLDGKELYSDVSVPNKSGTKNSRLPLSMQSIKNAVAATDLPDKDRDRMYEISQANQALYSKVESKEWTYAQYKEAKKASEQEYVQILSASPNYKKMVGLMDTLKGNGFFNEGGLGSTKSGQTYLWNSLNALLGSKGATPAANYPETGKGFTPWGRGGGGSGSKNTNKNGKTGTDGVKWTPAGKRQMAKVSSGKYTPVQIKVKLGNEVKKNRTQNYSDRSF